MNVRRSDGNATGLPGWVLIWAAILTNLVAFGGLLMIYLLRDAITLWADAVLAGFFLLVVLAMLTIVIVGVAWARRPQPTQNAYIFPAPNGATTITAAPTEVEVTKPQHLGTKTPWQIAAPTQPQQLPSGLNVRKRAQRL